MLYVEDDDTNWDVTVLRLKNKYRLHRAKNAVEACAQVRTLHGSLSAVLMDIQLQGSELDGVQLTRLFKGLPLGFKLPAYAQNLPSLVKVPILFVTANGERYEKGSLLQSGGAMVLPKPVDFLKLTVALNELMLANRGTLGRAAAP